MIDLGLFKIETDLFLFIVSLLFFTLQLVLCFRVKRLLFRLLPVLVLSLAAAVFFLLIFFTDDWDRIGFFLLAVWTLVVLAFCALAWLLQKIISRMKKEKNK